MDISYCSVKELRDFLDSGAICSEEIVLQLLKRIEKYNASLGAFITVSTESALEQAKQSDIRRINKQMLGYWDGIPLAIKDNICTCGTVTTCGSKILQGFIPAYDAHVIEQLRRNGAIFLGKTNMDEFAMGSSGENSAFVPTHNPYNLAYSPGGSSSGSAVAVSAGLAPLALGSDTGGSIRQPAALCGIYGLKPTYGRISRYGLVAFASSLDQVGILGHTPEDIANLLTILATPDTRDSTQCQQPITDFTMGIRSITQNSKGDMAKGLRIGIPMQYWEDGIHEEVMKAGLNVVSLWKDLGASMVPISLPHTKYAIPTYYVLATAEASSNLSRYDTVRYGSNLLDTYIPKNLDDFYCHIRAKGFGTEVKRRISLGTYVLLEGYQSDYYAKAVEGRQKIREEITKAFDTVDFILTPTSPIVGMRLGEKVTSAWDMYMCDIFTVTFSLSGNPAISMPMGFANNGLPMGIQMIGKHFAENTLLQYAHIYHTNSSRIHMGKHPLV